MSSECLSFLRNPVLFLSNVSTCLLCSDSVWSFNGVSCSEFVSSPGVENCEQAWAIGVDEDGNTVTAYVACEVSCGHGGAARDCVVPSEPEPEPEPQPEAVLEPEREPRPELQPEAEPEPKTQPELEPHICVE